MSDLTEENKRLAENQRIADLYHQDIIQNLNLDLADKIIAPDCIFHGPIRDARYSVRGPAQAKRIACTDHEQFKGPFKFIHTQKLAQGNLVGFVWRVEGTLITGQSASMTHLGVDIIRMEKGKIAEVWACWPTATEEQRRTFALAGWEY